MRDVSRLIARVATVVSLMLATTDPLAAQTLPVHLSVTAQPENGSSACELQDGCALPTAGDDTGTYVFSVHLNGRDQLESGVDAIRFTPTWPAEWMVLDVRECGGTVTAGDPAVSGSQLEIDLTECVEPEYSGSNEYPPVLQVVIECTVPGRYEWRAYPESAELRRCASGDWHDAFWYTSRVELGDFCGRLVQGACAICDRAYNLAGAFESDPLDVSVHQGDSTTERVHVRDRWCSGPLAQCGTLDYDGPCVERLESDAPWISVVPLSDQEDWDKYFDVTIATSALPVGVYESRLDIVHTGCYSCRAHCQEMRLSVLPPVPTETLSWGSVKGRF